MNRLAAILVATLFSTVCDASGGDNRSLEDVFSQSDVILHGAVIGAGIGTCGGKEGVNSFYIIRVSKVAKGDVQAGDVKACGSAPMLLANQYVIAGNKYEEDGVVFSPDAVLLVFPDDQYYRLIANDGPVVASDRGQAYAVGLLEPDFQARFKKVAMKKEESR